MFWIKARLVFYPYANAVDGEWIMVGKGQQFFLVLTYDVRTDQVTLVEIDRDKIVPQEESAYTRFCYHGGDLKVGGPAGRALRLADRLEYEEQMPMFPS